MSLPGPPGGQAAHLLHGHAGSMSRARRLSRIEGVFHLPQLGDVLVVQPLGLLRLMSHGAGRARQTRECIEVYLDEREDSVLVLWPCTDP